MEPVAPAQADSFFFSFSHRLYCLNIIILYTNVNFLQNSIFHMARSLHSPFYATFPSRTISPNHNLPDGVVVVQLLSCVQLCDAIDGSPPGSSVHEISQARVLEWVAISFFQGSFWPRDWTQGLTGRFFITSTTWEAHSCPNAGKFFKLKTQADFTSPHSQLLPYRA